MLQTDFEFELPRGFVDAEGNLHREGNMRLANAADEIAPLQDPRVQRNGAYLGIIVLSRVVTRLGSLPDVNPGVIEKMFAADVSYLQELYERINSSGSSEVELECPHCQRAFQIGESELRQESCVGG